MQPESHQPSSTTPTTTPVTISADGRCLAAHELDALLDKPEIPDVIELMIDGHRIIGNDDSPTLLGTAVDFLPESIHFSLSHFEPLEDGRCLARYVRRQS